MRRTIPPLLLILAVACGTTTGRRPESIAQPTVDVQQAGPIFFGTVPDAQITMQVTITNHASVPLVVREIVIAATANAQYTITTVDRVFATRIGPGETKMIPLATTAIAQVSRMVISEPLAVRAVVTFQAPDGTHFREVVLHQLANG